MLPFVSLNAVSSTGPGAARDFEATLADHEMVLVISGSPSSVNVSLEGSHDGSTWFQLTQLNPGASSVADTGVMHRLIRYVRANLITLTGGSTPTVTATIASS